MRGAGAASRLSRRPLPLLKLACTRRIGVPTGKWVAKKMNARRVLIEGRVQRVGYRDWAVRTARSCGVAGWVRNLSDGRVEILATGDDAAIDAFLDECRTGPPLADVTRLEATPVETRPVKGFTKRFTV